MEEATEFVKPFPIPTPGVGDPTPANNDDYKSLELALEQTRTIASAAALYNDSCVGADNEAYANNCAHFLSDAFIRAGYEELLPPHDCVNARCGTSKKRVIRARDLWCWFKEMAEEEKREMPSGEGFWAVFQLDEQAYWGGHVVIIDSDSNRYYGTGNYPGWDQYAYKW